MNANSNIWGHEQSAEHDHLVAEDGMHTDVVKCKNMKFVSYRYEGRSVLG